LDAAWFLKERTRFIRYFFDESSSRFREIQQKIENGWPPFDESTHGDDGEPPFLTEWIDAQTGIEMTGLACISMLSDTLKLYLQTLQKRVIGFTFKVDGNEEQIIWKRGFLTVYKEALSEILRTDWTDCPVRFELIEQLVLARNRAQHGSELTSFRVYHDQKTLRRYPRPFFASDDELKMLDGQDGLRSYLLAPSIEITRDNLFTAIGEMEALADWIDGRGQQIWDWRTKVRS
jgi:hypothetical protein